jgi:hypothetical protein
MRIPVSPSFTNRPNDFQVLNPATRVASGACDQMRRQLPKDYVHCRTMLSVRWKGLQGAGFRALRLT